MMNAESAGQTAQASPTRGSQAYCEDPRLPHGAYTPMPRFDRPAKRHPWLWAVAGLLSLAAPLGLFNATGALPAARAAAPAPVTSGSVTFPDGFDAGEWRFLSGTVKHCVDGTDRWRLTSPEELRGGLDVSETIAGAGKDHLVITEHTFNYGKGSIRRIRWISYYDAQKGRWSFGTVERCWMGAAPGLEVDRFCE